MHKESNIVPSKEKMVTVYIGKSPRGNHIWNHYNVCQQDREDIEWRKVEVPLFFIEIGLTKVGMDTWVNKVWLWQTYQLEKENNAVVIASMHKEFLGQP